MYSKQPGERYKLPGRQDLGSQKPFCLAAAGTGGRGAAPPPPSASGRSGFGCFLPRFAVFCFFFFFFQLSPGGISSWGAMVLPAGSSGRGEDAGPLPAARERSPFGSGAGDACLSKPAASVSVIITLLDRLGIVC